MGTYIIADSSVFILGKDLQGDVLTVPSVVKELKDISSRMKLQVSDVRIEEPSLESLRRATRAAKETGDLISLSSTDLDVLAKALEYQATVATDDYAVQNVAAHLGLKIEPVLQRGIKKVVMHRWKCMACNTPFDGDVCPVCGTPPQKRKKGW